jgi:hypothetical protein
MKRKLVTVDMYADQERIIYLVIKNKLKSYLLLMETITCLVLCHTMQS